MFDTMTRRGLMRTGLAAGAWAAGAAVRPIPARAGEAAAGVPRARFRLGMVTYLVGAQMDLPTLIDACEKSGMEGVELRTSHKHGVEPGLDAAARARVRETFAKTKVKLVMLGSTCEFHSPDAAAVKKNVEQAKEFVRLAVDVGAWGVKVRPNALPKDVPPEKTLKQIGDACREVGQFAKEKNIIIAVEMHGGGTSDPPNMARIMQACGHPSVGLCWNSNAGEVKNSSVKENFDLVKQWLKHCHVRDLTKDDYPWKELMTLFRGIGYDGYTMIETSTKEDPVEFLKKQRAAWEEHIA
ncbi:MAG: sugar phosphate isomerase/epimerase [Planctomycetes bacterium]|nr:sugar phosphate isomerase/epimerase [Planctomycetota bacterium]